MDFRSTVLNCSIEKYFEDKIFVVGQKTSKSAKFFTLENFKLYGTWLAIIFHTGNNYNVLTVLKNSFLESLFM